MGIEDDVEKLKEDATYRKGWHDGAFFVGKKMLLICGASISIATAGIYKTAYFVYEQSDRVRAAWEAFNAK